MQRADIDRILSNADNILKNQNLAGVNTVSKFRSMQRADDVINPAGSTQSLVSPNKAAPPVPPKPSSVSDHENSTGTGESVRLREVYLAERIQIEGYYIHKKCFKCGYCEQPLRLGNCGQDRNLGGFNPRFYCMQHINVPVPEKIAKIEKLDARSCMKPPSTLRVKEYQQMTTLSAGNTPVTGPPGTSRERFEMVNLLLLLLLFIIFITISEVFIIYYYYFLYLLLLFNIFIIIYYLLLLLFIN
ncbi:unnamed protein product [Anisakis simplex]|uniref:LIM zinc-binding domain-containing protein n=1 Tax=Anisakis simplex TaxID=6269 RepID=A0A0M3KH24_ANISI|nr:unnamed protein product [Anisakis simplex]